MSVVEPGFSGSAQTDRRRFLTTAGALLVGGAAAASRTFAHPSGALTETAAAGARAMLATPIVDTHQHLWNLETQKLPWLDGAPEVLKKTYWLNEYAAATEGLNIKSAVYMEVDIAPDQQISEADTLLEICRKGDAPTIAAVISGRPNSEEFARYIHRYAKAKPIKGVRQVLHPPDCPRGLCLEKQFVRSMNLLGEIGMSFDLCMRPEDLSDAVTLVRQCPGTRFVLDHCGNADPGSFLSESVRKEAPKHDTEAWKANILQLAEQSNVICKISGVIASAPTGVPFTDSLAPVINHCLDSFGPDRVIFGGDWPVCLLGAPFREWVSTLLTIISNRPQAEQEKLLHKNAEKFYSLLTQ
ncbi:MAG: amidohydrolase family protein [Planctomyces sp.]|nr:amidohydrolase family protein [Planctomyces sp.]